MILTQCDAESVKNAEINVTIPCNRFKDLRVTASTMSFINTIDPDSRLITAHDGLTSRNMGCVGKHFLLIKADYITMWSCLIYPYIT